MAQPFPYTYYSCDCYDSKVAPNPPKRASQPPPADDEDERTFDPRNARSNYSLYPLEHLLYCEDCQQIRCQRCVIEETLNWFCPSCLFEVPSSVIKSDGNRCTRNCYNCPVCTSPMTVNTLEDPTDPSSSGGPWILACPYCQWSTVEIGIEFEKHTGITSQLSRIANGGKTIPTAKERDKERERRKEIEMRKKDRDYFSGSEDSPSTDKDEGITPSHDDLFSNLSAFYKSQMASQTPSNPFSPHEINFSSPSSFSRIMNLYSSTTHKKQKREKPSPMREAASVHEGLNIHDPATDAAAIERIKRSGWSSTLSSSQKLAQPNPSIRFDSELRPVASLLQTKRGKRCRNCRHILSKPESKITSTRYKIKLLALNHIPRLSIRALSPIPLTTTQPVLYDYDRLRSGIPTHFLLHLSNPLFDPIRVTLATPSTTPGKIQSRVTILCPQFDVGANTDVWDDALSSTLSPIKKPTSIGPDGNPQTSIEAGKIWDRGRNWTSVVLEVVPGFLIQPLGSKEEEELEEDEDVLEIPIFVRLEFEADVNAEERGLGDSRGTEGKREKREEAFWTVVGVGRIVGN
ncbi:dynactin-like protein Arp1 p62 subunit RO2 [Clohesyomyces aquaticus]|uniref:Dynactin subunit 4 n=1 Tax=Clohesyomyces aquaticus TaxID=1231657 RepID=A0A1Y1Z791_9PLEO|nr:dynactin-like protein Arp1 p62 subunit RO2 [Clohesyomyces aquaticus]